MNADSLLALAGVIIAGVGLYLTARGSIKKDRQATIDRYEKEKLKAVADAIEPLARELTEMTADRNDWREQARAKDARNAQLQDQITRLLRPDAGAGT